MPAVSTARMTAQQFLELGEDPPGVRLELVDGEIEVSPSPIPRHSYAEKMLAHLLLDHIVEHDLGELFGDVPPDLAVEILSPSSVRTDRVTKFRLYEAGGVAHYWIVDPDARTIESYSLDTAGRYQPTGAGREADVVSLPPFPGCAIPVGQLWRS